ncbi:MAG: cytochrome c3 family protein [candidate division WOR-3 bacterium]
MKIILFFLIFQKENCIKKGCHDLLIEEKVLHPPAKEDCSSCHELVGKHPFKKIENVTELCLSCHSDKSSSKHPPVNEDCSICHNPHSSPINHLLKEKLPYLCSNCHKEILKNLISIHNPFIEGNCKDCHDVHGNNSKSYLLNQVNTLCFKCHTEMENFYKIKKYKHPPLENCINCHNPHSSQFPLLLNSMYPNKLYTTFTYLQYELCFNCHDQESIFSEKTNFKKNGLNLHEFHVKKDKGITCSLCHNPHYSDNPFFVEGGKKFGPNDYILTFKFEKNKKGGICGPACHGKAEY